jgi:hypothetical protein
MSLPSTYWPALAADYLTAYAQAFPSAGGIASEPSHRNAIILACSVAQHETQNGLAWPGSNNFGAVQLRALTVPEAGAFNAGLLKAGDYTPSRDGVLHVDTHPPGVPYAIWFAAFPTRIAGIVHFLKELWRISEGAPDADGATVESVVLEMYCGHYFEDRFKDDRGWQPRRAKPLSATEQKDVDDYAGDLVGGGVNACYQMICGALASWDYGRDANVTTADPTEEPTRPEIPLPFHSQSTIPPPPPETT